MAASSRRPRRAPRAPASPSDRVVRAADRFRQLKEILVETGHITANILFLIIAASMYSRMLGIAGLPIRRGLARPYRSRLLLADDALCGPAVLLGTIIETASII